MACWPHGARNPPNRLIFKAFSDFLCQVNYLPALVKALALTLQAQRAYLF